MVGVRVIVAHYVQAPRPRLFFHTDLFARIDQKPVSLRFPARLIERQQLLGALRIVPEICQRHHVGHFFLIAVGTTQKDPAAFARVVTCSVLADGVGMVSCKPEAS